ncbi:alkaline phosphatase family protein [Oceanospirillum sediminis]|uniref:Alkaline phosphatase family protein n=1 Tax=Oceanospirillum sediminis TaxID=2760088 RepID=A0A839IW33_9GAMM|nr:alkaline phosphatase family protein [Oceanospirillum sediminis]MBB1489181.1 alkaline phosphatase family protein [Oceanospirillum sediminis]
MGKLILIMIDGISASHFEKIRHQLPVLNRLARQGTQVQGVSPEMCGTSCPGRTSIITAAAPADHGVYGNFILDGDGFRWANPYDIRVQTLPELAKKQGKDVACVGYGMVRPEDCSVYVGPWWADEMLMRGKDQQPVPADLQWQKCGETIDPDGRIARLFESGEACEVVAPNKHPRYKLQLGMLADHQLLDIAAGLAASDEAPDLIMLEIAITDYFLHKYGAEHSLTEWSMRIADSQIGSLITRLEQSGKLDEYNFAIMSDHGHTPMPDALYVDRILGKDTIWSSEGAVLMVKPRDKQHAHEVTLALTEFGIQLWDNNHLPEELREDIITFITPKGSDISFEAAPDEAPEGTSGPSEYVSNHGMRPGRLEDYRFCIFSGPDVPQQILPTAYNHQVAPTMASIIGVETPWHAQPIFKRNA